VSEDDGGSKKGNKPQNDSSISSMTAEQIQELIAKAVKTQLGVGSQKSHLYTKPYTKRIDALHMPYGTNLPNSTNLMGQVTQNNMLHTSLRRATMLALAAAYY